MANIIRKYFDLISNIGIDKSHSQKGQRIKVFYNQITLIGGFATGTQAIFLSFFHPLSCVIMLSASFACFLALFIHKLGYFTTSRIISHSFVLLAGSIVSMMLGREYIYHLYALTVIISLIITFSKDEWKYVLIQVILAFILIFITETDYFKVEIDNFPSKELFRSMVIFGVTAFIIYEVLFAVRLNEQNEDLIETKLNRANQTVSIQNNEMSLMMREIHHRVKNNLQIIISILRLKSYDIEDEKSKEIFDSIIERIQAMALLHTKIYESKTINKLDVKGYLLSLSEYLINTYNFEKNIELDFESNFEQINNDKIISFGLILNELITNSFKHAFKDQTKGKIVLRAKLEGNDLLLSYSDSGKWIESKKKESFGLELITILSEQLSGTVDVNRGKEGTKYEFEFKSFL